MKTVAAHRLKKLRHLQAVENIAIWRRTHGFDRIADDDNKWAHGLLPPTPEQFTASLWSELNALKYAISMPVRDGSRQKTKSFIKKIEQGIVSFLDEEFAMIKRFVKKRGRDVVQVTVTPVDTVQYCTPRSPTSEPSFDACVYMEKKDEGRMNPERDQLESPLASMGFETPGQQYPPNGETGRTTAVGYLTAGVGPNLGGNTSSPKERVPGETLLHQRNAS